VHADLLVGISFGWWVPKHNRHHSNPNHETWIPTSTSRPWRSPPGQARDKRGLLLLLHFVGYVTALFLVLSPLQAAVFELIPAGPVRPLPA
jgi:hypothetical protein